MTLKKGKKDREFILECQDFALLTQFFIDNREDSIAMRCHDFIQVFTKIKFLFFSLSLFYMTSNKKRHFSLFSKLPGSLHAARAVIRDERYFVNLHYLF